MMANIDDVVRVSGASRSTVYRYFSGKSVKASTKEAINQAVKELNFSVNKLKTKRNYVIQIRIRGSRSASPEWKYLRIFNGSTEALNSMIDTLDEYGATVQVVRGDSPVSPDKIDGAIIMIKDINEESHDIEKLREQGIPFVMFYRQFDESDISFITCDNRQACYDITKYFVERGHKRIAICGDINAKRNSRQKFEGYAKCLEDNGIEVDADLICKESIIEDAQEWLATRLKKKNRPTAVIAMNDTYSICLSDAIKSCGLKIPEDVAVFGMDNSDATSIYEPSLSSVSIPFSEMGRTSVDILIELIENPGVKSIKKYADYKLIPRKSSEIDA